MGLSGGLTVKPARALLQVENTKIFSTGTRSSS